MIAKYLSLQKLRTLCFYNIMIKGRVKYRVLYADTDTAGVVYYGNYARFWEIGRTELIRGLGYAYKNIEDQGVIMPVRSVNAKYLKTLKYDELITIETWMDKMPGARAVFHTNIYNEAGELANYSEVTLVFLDMKTLKILRAPKQLINILQENGIEE